MKAKIPGNAAAGIASIASITAVFALALLMLFSPAYAQESQCLSSVDGSSSVTNATTGTNVVVSVSTATSSSDCTVSNLILESSPNTLTIVDPSSGQYSSFSAGETKSFTASAGTAGVYTITARGTTSGGSVSDNTAVVIEFVNPSTLTVAGSPSTVQVNHSSSFTLTINISNSQASTIATSYALNLPTGFTKESGDDTSSSSLSIAASSTTSRSWVIKHNTCKTSTHSLTFDLGDSTSVFTTTITGNTSCASGTSGGTSPGSGGGGTTTPATETPAATPTTETPAAKQPVQVPAVVEQKRATATIAEINPGEGATVTLDKSEELGVRRISISVKNQVKDVQITVTKQDGKPAAVTTPSGVAFAYLDITTTNVAADDLESVKIEFEVDRSWVAANNIDEGSVALLRFADRWVALKTTKLSDTDTKIIFEAESPGFSTFAITGQAKIDYTLLLYFVIGIVVVVIVGGFAHYHVFKKKPGKYEFRR